MRIENAEMINSTIKEQKIELRRQVGEEISALPDDYVADSDEGIYLKVATFQKFLSARNIMLYYSVKKEPCTHKIAKAAWSMGKTVAFPLCYRAGIMQAHVVSSLNELQPAILGIPAPPGDARIISADEFDLIIVPALTYDSKGYRLGYGGGYYDRYLRAVPAYTLGLARERLVRDKLPIEQHDIPVDCVITELSNLIPNNF